MESQNHQTSRFDMRSNHIKDRTERVNSFLRKYNVIAATGSIIEAHLLVRLRLSGGLPNLIGCGTNHKEVIELCSNMSNILLFMTESISLDYGEKLVNMLRKEVKSIKIVYFLQEPLIAQKIRSFDVNAILMCSSFGSGAVVTALSKVAEDRRYFDPAFIYNISKNTIRLTRREQQVLQRLQFGLTNKEISVELSISTVTVRDYIRNLMFKLDASNRTMVVANARNKGLI